MGAQLMGRIKCQLAAVDVLGHVLIWALFAIITCGFALFLFPYSFGETVINRCSVVDGNGRVIGRLRCTASPMNHILHAFVWWLLAIVTLGIAGFFYLYSVASSILSATTIDSTVG
jgi:hypothetical protein